MADNSFKINKSANFNPQSGLPANPLDGDWFFDSSTQSFTYYHGGFWACVDSVGTLAATEPMTGAQFTPAVVRNALVKVTGASTPKHLDGISASHTGKSIKIYNAGTSYITVEHEDSGEPTANNRIRTPTAGDMNLIAGEVATFTYDIIANRWLLVSISSQGGAQLIATTSSPGLTTLHQASLFPFDGIVLSDGDLNTATGVVGLDANRAAAIIAPLSAVTTLTLTAHASASALSVIGATGAAAAKFKAGASGNILQWIDSGGTSLGTMDSGGNFNFAATTALNFNSDGNINFNGFGTIDFVGPGSIIFQDETSTIQFPTVYIIEQAPNLLTIAQTGQEYMRFQINPNFANLRATGPTASVIYDFYANEGEAAVQLRATTNHPLQFHTNNIRRWSMNTSGDFTSESGGWVRNITDPQSAQDAATKLMVDHLGPINLVQNGSCEFFSRAHSFTTGAFNNSSTPDRRACADRWWYRTHITTASGPMTITNSRVAADSAAISKYAMRSQLTVAPTGSWGTEIIHEFDRDLVKQFRGSKLSFNIGMKRGANFSGPVEVRIVAATGATPNNNECSNWDHYTGTTTVLLKNVTPTASFANYTSASPTAQVVIPPTTVFMALVFTWGSSFNSNSATNNYVDICDVSVTASTYPSEQFIYHGGSRNAEQLACQAYVENSFDDDSAPGDVQAGNSPFWGIMRSLGDSSGTTVNDTAVSIPFKVKKRFDEGFAYPLCGLTVTIYDSGGANPGNITVSNVGNKATGSQQVTQYGIMQMNLGSSVNSGADFRCHWLADSDLFK